MFTNFILTITILTANFFGRFYLNFIVSLKIEKGLAFRINEVTSPFILF
jgi:hypothetical protein